MESTVALRDLKVEVESLKMTALRVSPKEPSLSAEERVTLTKQAPTDTVYKILDTKKEGRRKTTQPKRYQIMSSVGRDMSPKSQSPQVKKKPLIYCGLCENKGFGNRAHLYDHYSQFHFKDQLKAFIDEDGDQCPLCRVVHRNPNEANKIRHIGTVHGMVEKFLPSHLRIKRMKVGQEVWEFRVPKSQKGNFLKKRNQREEEENGGEEEKTDEIEEKKEERDKEGSVMEKEMDAFDGNSLVEAPKKVQPSKSL